MVSKTDKFDYIKMDINVPQKNTKKVKKGKDRVGDVIE